MASNRRKSAAIALAVVGIAGLSLASASQLGVTSSILQAGTDTVDQCDTDGVAVSYTYAFSGGQYVATGATISDIECPTGTIGFTYAGTVAAAVSTTPTAVTGASMTIPFGTPLAAADLANVAVVLTAPGA